MPQLASPAALSGDVTSDVSLESSDDLSKLSAMLDADEAADRGADGGQDDSGPEDGDDSADPTVAGADQTSTEGSGEGEGDAQATTDDNSGTTAAKPGDHDQQQQQQQELTPYQKARQKERARIAKQWKLINEQKLANAQEAARLEARAQQAGLTVRDAQGRFTAPQANPQANGNGNGTANPVLEYSSDQYLEGADRFTTMAQEAEARGDFAEANRNWELAETAREVAVEAQQAERTGATRQAQAPQDPTNGWAQARTDFPELLDRSSDAHKHFVQFLREHPSVADYPNGPYLAAAFVVSRLAAGRMPELQKEAALVPELRKQVDQLTAKVKELTRYTRVTPSGNPPNRTEKPAKQFGDLSMAEMEAQLDREVAELRG